MMNIRYLIIALATVSMLSATSCGNRNGQKNSIVTKETVEVQKSVLADSVLAIFDSLADKFADLPGTDAIMNISLTEKEKLIKPTYLLEPEIANTLVTKQQKINALAIYIIETAIRKAYDMPTDKAVEAIVKLSTELNHPVDIEEAMNFEIPASKKARKIYTTCKERGEISYFWKFDFAFITELQYVIANNPDLFLDKIPDNKWESFVARNKGMTDATRELAKYDGEMNMLDEFIKSNMVAHNIAVDNEMFQNKEMARQTFIEYKLYFFDIRNNLLD